MTNTVHTVPTQPTTLHTTQGSKYRKAASQPDKTKIITEDELYQMITNSLPAAQRAAIQAKQVTAHSVVMCACLTHPPPSRGCLVHEQAKESAAAQAALEAKHKAHSGSKSALWTDAHRPRRLADLIGNTHLIRELYNWLQRWDDVHRKGVDCANPAPLPKQRLTQRRVCMCRNQQAQVQQDQPWCQGCTAVR